MATHAPRTETGPVPARPEERTGRRRAAGLLALLAALAGCGEARPRDRWHTAPTRTPEPRLESTAARVGRRIYFVGGITGDAADMRTAQPSDRTDVYDPDANVWTSGPPLPPEAPKHHLTLAVLDERLYIVGGFDGIIGRTAGEEFRPVAASFVLEHGAWRRVADAPLARGGATAQVIAGKIYVAGGTRTEGVDPYADLYEYDPARDAWTRRAPMPTAREHVASCRVGDRMIVVGGWVGASRASERTAEMYDPATDRWTALPPMSVGRGGLGAVAVGQTCYAIGGEDWQLPPPGTFGTVEAFDLERGAWRTLAPMPTARHGAGVVELDGRILVLGGGPSLGNSYTDVVEVYEP